MPRLPFGRYEPDLPRVGMQGLLRAENAFPAPVGYDPVPSFEDLGFSAIAEFPRGAISALDAAGTPNDFIGTQSKLYRVGPLGITDVSKGGGYNCSGTDRWSFAQFGNIVIAVNYNDPQQYFDLGTSTLFADLAAATAPRARHVGVVGNFVVVGNLFDAIFGNVPDSVWWSAINDPFSWPTPGTDLATSVQSDRQPLRGDGGPVNAIVSGAEVGAIFQERAIWRMDYRGGAVVFDLTRVESTHGLLIPGLAVPYGRFVFYLSEEGFRIWDYQESTPIGKGVVDQTFFADFDAQYPHRVWAAKDPDATRIWVIYPGAGNAGGRPNKALFYDYVLGRFSHGAFELEALLAALEPVTNHLDSLPADDLDTFEPLTSFDASGVPIGPRKLGAIDANLKFGTMTGPARTAIFETGDLQLVPYRSALFSSARPEIQGAGRILCQLAGRSRLEDDVIYGPQQGVGRSGVIGLRKDARYHRLRTTVDGGWTELVAHEIEFVPTGYR